MPTKTTIWNCILLTGMLLVFLLGIAGAQEGTGGSQSETSELRESVRQMQLQIQQMQQLMREMKEEADRYHAETQHLEHELELTREKLGSLQLSSTSGTGPSSQGESSSSQEGRSAGPGEDSKTEQRLTRLEEDAELMNQKIEDQYQTKVESAARHRVKLSGILLMNIFSNKGFVDHMETPSVALPTTPSLTAGNTGGSFGATFRQSELGLEVFGPTIAGAKTEANFVADFFGEFPETVNGSASGQLRLRTGFIRLDWAHTSVVAGMDSLFFSPLYATSFASLGIPAFSYSGALWGWIPQLRIEHRFGSEKSTFTISGGILDPLSGEPPPNEWLRIPGPGESSRQPGYAARLEWKRKVFGQPLVLGFGGYYSRENWGFNRNIDGWSVNNDWIIPLGSRFSLSGTFYSGRAIGGLGAGIGRSVVWNRPLTDPTSVISPIGTIGGWSQLKYKPHAKIEFNVAAGQDTGFASDVRGFAASAGYLGANLTRNRSEFANFIYRPRSNLLFSTEFRTWRTYVVDGGSDHANQLNLVMGVLF